MMRGHHETLKPDWTHGNPIPFPGIASRDGGRGSSVDSVQLAHLAMTLADRRMLNLARLLGCLGHFEEDEGGPRAA